MVKVLKIFGYVEKTSDTLDAIKNACILNAETKDRLDRIRATLNGEDKWFTEFASYSNEVNNARGHKK